MSEHIQLKTFKSGSVPRRHKVKIKQRIKQLVGISSRIRKDHWEPDKENPTCFTCNRRFKIFLRRHHCRLCGKVYCHHCSGYKMRLDDEANVSMNGRFHRVCFRCKGDSSSFPLQLIVEGVMTSWMKTFRFLREEVQRRPSPAFRDISIKQFYADVIKVCRPAVDMYTQSYKKKGHNILTRVIGGAISATTELEGSCSTCNKDLVNPTKRRQCSICKSTLCKPCTIKDLVIYSMAPSLDNTPDINIAFLGYIEERKIEVNCSQTFRLCISCRGSIQVEDEKARFNEQLHKLQANLIHLNYQINESVNQIQDGLERHTLISKPNSPLITQTFQKSLSMLSLDSWSEMDDLEESPSKKTIRISGIKMSKGLLDDFYKKYQQLLSLESLVPTETHRHVFQNMSRAMSNYYNHSMAVMNYYTKMVNETSI